MAFTFSFVTLRFRQRGEFYWLGSEAATADRYTR